MKKLQHTQQIIKEILHPYNFFQMDHQVRMSR